MRVLMVGCGDLGSRIARGLADRSATVFALTRSVLSGLPVISLRGDVTQPSSLPEFPDALDEIVYCLTPAHRDEASYRRIYLDGLDAILARIGASPNVRLGFVSSTAVYGACDGEWVDEASACLPDTFNGKILLDAEQLALAANARALVYRLGGICGPGRDRLIRQVRLAEPISAEALAWGNRIHVDDAAAAICHLMAGDFHGRFNLVDSRPAPAAEVMDWIAGQWQLSPRSRPMNAAAGLGRRVSNAKLLGHGYEFLYPDYRSGYATLIDPV